MLGSEFDCGWQLAERCWRVRASGRADRRNLGIAERAAWRARGLGQGSRPGRRGPAVAVTSLNCCDWHHRSCDWTRIIATGKGERLLALPSRCSAAPQQFDVTSDGLSLAVEVANRDPFCLRFRFMLGKGAGIRTGA